MAKYYGKGGAREITKHIEKLGEKHSRWKVFEDFVAMSAISISNSLDWTHHGVREKQYLDIVKKYEKKELELFPEMFALLVEELEINAESPKDVLGPIFHELELHNKYNGQFFTPGNICDMMGMMTFSKNDQSVKEKGHITLCEPCAGSGAMILGFVKAMAMSEHNFRTQLVVTATDIDMKCVYMTYIQLSLYGIPAVVIHGDTLLMKEWSRWYTPVYMLDNWVWRQSCGNLNKRYVEDEIIKRATNPIYAAMQQLKQIEKTVPVDKDISHKVSPKYDIELKINQNGQMSLF